MPRMLEKWKQGGQAPGRGVVQAAGRTVGLSSYQSGSAVRTGWEALPADRPSLASAELATPRPGCHCQDPRATLWMETEARVVFNLRVLDSPGCSLAWKSPPGPSPGA